MKKPVLWTLGILSSILASCSSTQMPSAAQVEQDKPAVEAVVGAQGFTECNMTAPVVGCTITVRAIDHLAVTATSGNRNPTGAANYNPPAGYAILSTNTLVWSSNSGSRSVSTLAAGSTFVSNLQVQNSYNLAMNVYRDLEAKAVIKGIPLFDITSKFKAGLDQKYSSFSNIAQSYAASHNTINATVSASYRGFPCYCRGWEDISVDATLIYVGTQQHVTDQFQQILDALQQYINNYGTAPVKKAMTWKLLQTAQSSTQTYGLVGIHAASDAYNGDTLTSGTLPMLCINKSNLPNPGTAVIGTHYTTPGGAYRKTWSGGTIALTAPIKGQLLTSRAVADGICAQNFGAGYRMAEFHDGDSTLWAGWDFWAAIRGNNLTPFQNTTFWMAINGTSANPW
ncbi:hypothetical protein [Deinococcus misasensis]|uniref:hypothetical protein n=1 Tax=Deinococcus misasensis TaxID=392413 RepID=UPI000A46F949|nr:hypothetical protein [Deinococcus misasensis]